MKKSLQIALIQIARNALHEHFGMPVKNKVDVGLFPGVKKKSGVFVSLYLHGEIRGCVGHLEGDLSRGKAVRKMAIAAATSDPRFETLNAKDIPHVSIEISVLSPFILTSDFSTIKVGEHGLLVEVGDRYGLLLPQVAEKYKWSATGFLEKTCVKAGLPPDAYRRPDAKISLFTATVIKE